MYILSFVLRGLRAQSGFELLGFFHVPLDLLGSLFRWGFRPDLS